MKFQNYIFCIIVLSIVSCITQEQVSNLDQDSRMLYPYSDVGKWGYTDESGEIVIKPQFDSVSFFSNGLAVVVQNERFGYLNKSGEWHIKPKFKSARDFTKDNSTVTKRKKSICINKKGRRIKCEPGQIIAMCGNGLYQPADPNKYLVANANNYELLLNYTLVDIYGNEKEIPYRSNVGIDTFYRYSREYLLLEKNKKFALYRCLGYESEVYGVSNFANFKPTSQSLLDSRLEFIYDEVRYGEKGNKKLGYDEVSYAEVRIGNKWGVIDRVGNIVTPIAYQSVEIKDYGLALVEFEKNRKGYREFNQVNGNEIVAEGREFFKG